jgi:hypothetical protein
MAKKHGNGEGGVRRRKDGRWEARYTVQTATGPKRKTIYGKTRAETAVKLAKALAERPGAVRLYAHRLPSSVPRAPAARWRRVLGSSGECEAYETRYSSIKTAPQVSAHPATRPTETLEEHCGQHQV